MPKYDIFIMLIVTKQGGLMKKGKFRIISASILICLMIAVTILSGCSLVTINYAEYYKAIVASAETKDGKRIEITKKDLMLAYSSYGSQYVSYYGWTKEKAIEATLKQLISTKLVVDKVENYLKEKNNGSVLTAKEKTYLWEKTYDSIVSNLENYMDKKDDDTNADASSSGISVDNYEKKADVVYDYDLGEYKIVKREDVKTTVDAYTFWSEGNKDASKESGRAEIYNLLGDLVTNNSDYAKPYSKYLTELKRGEEGQKLSTSNKSVMLREIERIYNIVYESYLTTRYEEIYKKDVTNVTVNDVLELYKSKVLDDYTKYKLEKSATYNEDILSSADKYYHPESNVEFFYITHILIKFDNVNKDESGRTQQDWYDYYNKILTEGEDGKTTTTTAQNEIDALYDELRATVRELNEDGKYIETQGSKTVVTANAVLDEVDNALAVSDNATKVANFYELMFKHTEDDSSTLNAQYNYVIGVDYTENTYDDQENLKTNYKAYSSMVENFTNEAIRLYDHGNGQVGDHSTTLIKSNYGYHILMYAGKIENLCDNVSLSMNVQSDVVERLYETKLNVCRDYTYFDLLYDELVKDNFSSYQTKDINYMISNLVEYNFYYNAYKDLL